jgi:hypothetical protein
MIEILKNHLQHLGCLNQHSKRTKKIHENDSLELNTIEVFDKYHKLINGATSIQGDLVSIKCYI